MDFSSLVVCASISANHYFFKKKICEKKARLNSEILYFSQVLKGALFRTATEQKEQTRYFSKSVLVLIAFPVIVCLIFY